MVKLHGTVSNAFSVMGSLDDIEDLTPSKQKALERLLMNHSHLATVGWSASDLDIINVISKLDRNNRPTLWAVSIDPLDRQPGLHNYLSLNNMDDIYNYYEKTAADNWLNAKCDEMKIPHLSDNERIFVPSEYDEIYKPMTMKKKSRECHILRHKNNPVIIVHAANQKEIPESFTRATEFFFSPMLTKSDYEHIFRDRTNSICPPYSILDLPYPGDYPFAAHSKDVSHIVLLAEAIRKAGFHGAEPSMVMNELQVTAGHLKDKNVISFVIG